MRAGFWSMIAAAACSGVSAAATNEAEPPRVAIADVLALPPATNDAPRSVRVRGVVTIAANQLAIQDGEHGILIVAPPVAADAAAGHASDAPAPAVGDEVEVVGYVEWTTFAPRLRGRSLRIMGPAPLPEPVRADPIRLFSGGHDAQRIELVGVVQGVRTSPTGPMLMVATASRSIAVESGTLPLPRPPAELVDATLRVTGVTRSIVNPRGEFIAPILQVARPEDVEIVLPPAAPPFSCLEVPLREVGRYRLRPFLDHRFRTRGTVSFAVPGVVFLEDGNGGVRVDTAGGRPVPHGLKPGDVVEVAGFLSMGRRVAGISEAQVRKVGSAPAPKPVAIDAATIVNTNLEHRKLAQLAPGGSYDGCLVRCTGRLEAIDTTGAAIALALDARGTLFNALLYEPLPPGLESPWPPIGSEVAVTGIVEIDREPVAVGDVQVASPILRRVDIILRSPADVTPLRPPPWWTPARLAAAVGGLAALALGAGIWVLQLRREVARQTARAVAEATARREAALEYEITLRERNRIAANLHDTVLQSLTGIGFQLKACGKSVPPEAVSDADSPTAHVAIAEKMVDHAASQLRGTVWSLRALQADGRPFSAALDDLADSLGAGHAARIAARVDPAVDELPVPVTGNLLLVIQEAIHNALHHGTPRTIDVAADVDRDAGTLAVTIRDDGPGFDMGSAPGPKQGHFGLAGMQERVSRLGGTFSIATSPGRGTHITATLPVAATADTHSLEPRA